MATNDDLEDLMVAREGELITGEPLRKSLGFTSERSFSRAVQTGQCPVSVFALPGRRGRFARTRDVARWLDRLGGDSDRNQ
jgi:hypothetical protein